jgi:hypothetical protein
MRLKGGRHYSKRAVVRSVLDPSAVRVRKRKYKPSIYQPVFDQLWKMKAGECIRVAVPKGLLAAQYINRLNAAISNAKIVPTRGCIFRKQVSESERAILIFCKQEYTRDLFSSNVGV